MINKKKDSFWMEPYNTVKLLGSAFLLIGTFFKLGFRFLTSPFDSSGDELEKNISNYAAIQIELSRAGAAAAWKRFILTGMIIQIFLIIFTVLHFAVGDIVVGLELLVITVCSIIFFGYKPWILRNERYVSFSQYLKILKSDLRSLCLWYSYNKVK